MTSWILIVIAILVVILLAVYAYLNKKGKRPTDYYNMFVIGIIWTAVGIPLQNYVLSLVGILFMINGLMHRDKWKENKKSWKDLNSKERKVKLLISGVSGLLVLIGLGVLYLTKIGVISL